MSVSIQSLFVSITFAAIVGMGSTMSTAQAKRPNRSLTIPDAGGVKIDLNFEVSLAEGAFFDPIALSPDFYYGINKDFAFALVHSSASQGVFGVGRSIRIKGVGDAYNGSNLEGFYTFLRGDTLNVSAQGGLSLDALQPEVWVSVKVGGLLRAVLGPVDLVVNPYMYLPLNKSDFRGNKVVVPVWAYYKLNVDLDVLLVTGLNDEGIQLGGGVNYNLPGPVDVGVQLGWPRIAGDGGSATVMTGMFFASMNL